MAIQRNKEVRLCYFDEKRNVMVHIFGIHKCRCLCGKKIIRTPAKDDSFLYGSVLNK